MSFQVKEDIAKILSEKQQYEKRFKSCLGAIVQSIGKCLIQIVGIKDSNISRQLQQEFLNELNHHVDKNLDIKDLQSFIGLSKEQFLEQYQVVVSKVLKEYHFVSLNQYLDQIKIIIINTQKYKKENKKTKIIKCPNILVFNFFKEQQIQQSSIPDDDIQIIYSQNQKIILQGIGEQELGNKLKGITLSIQQLEKQLTSLTCTFQEKQVKFFEKHFKQYCNNLENERKVSIKFQQKNKYFLKSQVISSSKRLQLVQANVIQLVCDAIVNFIIQSEDKTALSDLSKSIIGFGGSKYQKSVFNQIKNFNKSYNQVDINTYELSSFRNIHYIINVVTSTQYTKNIYHSETIKSILDALFLHLKDSLEIRSLAMPILNDTENQYSNNYSMEIYLKTIINKLFNDNHTIKKVYLAEEKNPRINQMNSILLIQDLKQNFMEQLHNRKKQIKRYLWHGVSSQHPKVIYTSLAEAFDVTFSNVGLLRQGIYFAENASYLRSYSYKLTNQDDPKYADNLVFLCCLVTTGKAEQKYQCRDIRKPSEVYDSVTGMTSGSNIFVLYQMHVRRAYPAYEVIFS